MRPEKQHLTKEYLTRLNGSPFFIVVNYRGLKVSQITELRKRLSKAGAEVHTPVALVRWQSALAAHLERFKRYPTAARARHEQGVVRVAFTIDHEGHLLHSEIVQSSGSPPLDQETLDMLSRAQPMPKPPGNTPDSALSFIVPIRFNIR